MLEKFCERLKRLKKRDGVSQMQLIADLHVSKRAMIYYEQGERLPPLETAAAIAEYFNVSLDYLVGRSDDPRRLP